MHSISESEDEGQKVSVLSSQRNDNGNSNSIKTKGERKRISKEDREKLREEKLLEKLEKKKIADLWKQMQPGECLKYVTVIIDSTIISDNEYKEFITALGSAEIQYKIGKDGIPFSITWIRKQVADDLEVNELETLVVWKYDIFLDAVNRNSLCSDLSSIASCFKKKVILIIFGIEDYFRYCKIRINRNLKASIGLGLGGENTKMKKAKEEKFKNQPLLSGARIDNALVELQLLCNVCYRFVESGLELVTVLTQFTKAISERPYKLSKYKKEQNVDWYAAADSKECVRVDNNGCGLSRLWLQQISQLNLVSTDMAEAIISQYKSPNALIEAYSKCATQKEAELLLKDIPVRRKYGPLSSVRKIGPELSTKVYLLFNSDDGELPLSQD